MQFIIKKLCKLSPKVTIYRRGFL